MPGQPAAKQGDRIVALDKHMIQPPASAPQVLVPHPFSGILDGGLSTNVRIEGRPAATRGSTATNTPSHMPIGGTFVDPPTNRGTIEAGSQTVSINGRPAARAGDTASTCNTPAPASGGAVVATSRVLIGG